MHQLTAFENIVGKEEIARNDQFIFFHQYFYSIKKYIPICQYLWGPKYHLNTEIPQFFAVDFRFLTKT